MIITLCGSARFEPWYHMWNEALSLAGHVVFGLAAWPSMHDRREWYSEDEKNVLDYVHKRKIDASDAILVLNVFAYIGESTLNEIEYARRHEVRTHFLESWGMGLGIGGNHNVETRAARDMYKVPLGYGSPISTVEDYEHPSPWDLLGDGGLRRSSIVDRLQARTLAARRFSRQV